MITILTIPPQFNITEKENMEKVKNSLVFKELVEYCNGDEKIVDDIFSKAERRLLVAGKLIEDEEKKWDHENPEFIFDYIRRIHTEVFDHCLDTVSGVEPNVIINVCIYRDRIEHLFNPDHTSDYELSSTIKLKEDEEEEDEG